MSNSVLYRNIIDATTQIVKQFGKGMIFEQRFVNVLSDLAPGRTEPAVFKIIKSSTQDGLLKPVLNANAKSIEHQVATATATLSKQYGYDHSLVEGILFSLAIGYGTITTAQYNALKALKNKPTKKQTPPSQNNNPNPNQPNKQTNSPNKQPNKYDSTEKKTAILLWGIIGLLASPIVYALQINVNLWWPLPTSIVIAIIHLITVFPVSIAFDDTQLAKPNIVHPALQGAFCSLYIIAIFFWIVFPFFWGLESVQSYWGFTPNKESFPWLITILGNIFCALVLGTGLSQTVAKFSPNWRKNQGSFSDNFNDLFNNKLFRKGFFAVFVICIIECIYLLSIPVTREFLYKQRIEDYNKQVNAFNQHSDSIRNARIQTERDLSFAMFKLGESYVSCVSDIKNNNEYTFTTKITYKDQLELNDIDYISIVDTILYVKTNWNNEDITIDFYFADQRLIAPQFAPQRTNGDSILASYTAKYGEPEAYLTKIETPNRKISPYDYKMDYLTWDNNLVADHYFWTYKNALLKIDYRPGSHYYSSNYSSLNEHATITYFDRGAESLLQQHQEEQTRKAKEYQKRQNDSLRLVREAEERERQEQRRQEELNHQRSMEQI